MLGIGCRCYSALAPDPDNQHPALVNQTNHFIDLGYGWLCKHCSAADAEAKQRPQAQGRGNPGEPAPKPYLLALASWTDASRNALFCPRCGIHEPIRRQA